MLIVEFINITIYISVHLHVFIHHINWSILTTNAC